MSKVLFVCRSNAGRSQAAEFFFKDMEKAHTATSAGTSVDEEGKVGAPAGRMVVEIVAESGRDISSWKRKQVTPEMVKDSDKVVVLMLKDEAETYVPGYIKNSGKVEYWYIDDMRGTDMEFHRVMMEKIKAHVAKLIEKL